MLMLQDELPIEDLEPEGVDAYVVDLLGTEADDAFEVEADQIRSVPIDRSGDEVLRLGDAVVGTSYKTW